MTKLEVLKELAKVVRYNKNVGSFFWRKHVGGSTAEGKPAGCVDWGGYLVICFKGQRIKAHRLAWHMIYDEDPPEAIDHIDGCTTNNRISNLRATTAISNGRNRVEHRNGHLIGTSFRKDNKKWVCQFWKKGRRIYLGQFETQQEAHKKFLESEWGKQA